MRITRKQIRKILHEVSTTEKNAQGVGTDALYAFLQDELFPKEKKMSLKDAIEQSEGSGFAAKDAEEVIKQMIDNNDLIDKDGMLELR